MRASWINVKRAGFGTLVGGQRMEVFGDVTPPKGRRGKQGDFVFSTERKRRNQGDGKVSARAIFVTDLAELRRRNKLACARVVTEDPEGSRARQSDSSDSNGSEIASKSEKMFRQRKASGFASVVVVDSPSRLRMRTFSASLPSLELLSSRLKPLVNSVWRRLRKAYWLKPERLFATWRKVGSSKGLSTRSS